MNARRAPIELDTYARTLQALARIHSKAKKTSRLNTSRPVVGKSRLSLGVFNGRWFL